MKQWGMRVGAVIAVAFAFAIVAAKASAETATWGNNDPITFSGANVDALGSLYPSTVSVSGLEGPITDVDLTVSRIDMSNLGHLSLLLVSPSGEAEVATRLECYGEAAANQTFVFDQDAPSRLPGYDEDCPGDRYRPSDGCNICEEGWVGFDNVQTDDFDNFLNENANGNWSLYARRDCDDGCPASGDAITQGFSVKIVTGPVSLDLPTGGPGITSGPASPYPLTQAVTGDTGLITDLNVRLDGVFHTYPDDIEVMLEKVGGPKVMLMSDACGSSDAIDQDWLWNDDGPPLMPDEGVCGTGSYRPSDHNPGDSLPAPAPAGPYSTSLSSFDLTDPKGEYRLWVADDGLNDEGFIAYPFRLEYITRPRANTAFGLDSAEVAEGAGNSLVVRRNAIGATAPATVVLTSAPGTAGAGDFTPITQTVQFGPNENQKTITVDALADAESEDAETFTVTLSSPTGDAAVGTPATATVTIPANTSVTTPAPSDPTPTPSDPTPPPLDSGPDTAAPETLIDKAPKRATSKRTARVRFSATEVGSRFECKLDKAQFAQCSSPLKLKRLDPGKHRLRVRAIDQTGNTDPTPAKVRWRVVMNNRSPRRLR